MWRQWAARRACIGADAWGAMLPACRPTTVRFHRCSSHNAALYTRLLMLSPTKVMVLFTR